MKRRCEWSGSDPLYIAYHDSEWGVPIREDRRLFEMLVLEGAQAGLSWMTVLRKREAYRRAFDDFDPEKVARYDDARIRGILENPRIIRNRLKVRSAVQNARAFLKVAEEFGSFQAYLWEFVGGRPIQNRWSRPEHIPPQTRESDRLSRDLKKREFSFIGSTICYAFMQAVGMVNDHLTYCFRYREIKDLSSQIFSPRKKPEVPS